MSEALVFALSLLVYFVRSRRKEPNSVEEDMFPNLEPFEFSKEQLAKVLLYYCTEDSKIFIISGFFFSLYFLVF